MQSRSFLGACVDDQDADELETCLQEGRWNILWMSGRFKTVVRMQEDMPHGHLTSSSLKSTIFNEHEGEWQVSSLHFLDTCLSSEKTGWQRVTPYSSCRSCNVLTSQGS